MTYIPNKGRGIIISTISSNFLFEIQMRETAPQPAADAHTYFNWSAFAGVCGRLRASAGKPLVYPRRRRPQPPADAPSMYGTYLSKEMCHNSAAASESDYKTEVAGSNPFTEYFVHILR